MEYYWIKNTTLKIWILLQKQQLFLIFSPSDLNCSAYCVLGLTYVLLWPLPLKLPSTLLTRTMHYQ